MHEAQGALSARILSHYRPELANVEHLLRRPPRGNLERRLALYGEGYGARLHEALGEIFPAVAHLAGRAAFAAAVRRYAAACAPRLSYNLNDSGALFADFLAADVLTEELPFAPDLALLEWMVSRAFHAELEAPFDPRRAASWTLDDWQRACIRFQPSLAVVRSAWPIRTLWELRDVPHGEIDVAVEGRPESVVVLRTGGDVRVELVQDAQAQAIAALARGRRLDDVAAELADRGLPAQAASDWLARLQRFGAVVEVEREP